MGRDIEVHQDHGRKCELVLEPIGEGGWLASFHMEGSQKIASTTQPSREGALEWGDFMLTTVFGEHHCGEDCILLPRAPSGKLR